MTLQEFTTGIEEIYAIFGKKSSEERVNEIVYRRVMNLPPEFMTFAVRHFEDQESLPRNMGYYLKQILWPEFLDKNPDLRSNQQRACCPNCCPEMPGWRRVFRIEKTALGDFWTPEIVRCACGNAPNPRGEKVMSDYELVQCGFSLQAPDEYKNRKMSDFLASAIGHNEQPRQNHAQALEEADF